MEPWIVLDKDQNSDGDFDRWIAEAERMGIEVALFSGQMIGRRVIAMVDEFHPVRCVQAQICKL